MVAAGIGTSSPLEDPGTEPEVLEAVKLALKLGGDVNAVDKKGGGEDVATADKSQGGPGGAAWKQDAPVPVSSDDPSEGPKNALVTIVEFSDYQ